MKSQRALVFLTLRIGYKQLGQRTRVQISALASQQIADRRRHIDQLPASVGLPEPALPSLLEVMQNFFGAQLRPLPLAVSKRVVGVAA